MAKCKKEASKLDSKIHLKSKKKLKNKFQKLKKHKICSLLNQNGQHCSQAYSKHVNNREIPNVFNSSWNIEICDFPQFKHVNGKVRKHNKNKHRSHCEEIRVSHSSFNFNGLSPTANDRNYLSNSSWNIESNNDSSFSNIQNVKKCKTRKRILKEANKNLSSKNKKICNRDLLGSVLISDTESQTEDDEPIETIVKNKYNRNSKLNVNFVNFNAENVKSRTSKIKKKLKNKKKRQINLEDSKISKILQIGCNRNENKKILNKKLKSNKKCLKKIKQKINKKEKQKMKKSKIEIIDVTANVKNDSEVEVHKNVNSFDLNESIKTDTEVEILDSTTESSEIKDTEIIENTETRKVFFNQINNDSEVEIIESSETSDVKKNVDTKWDSDVEVIENIINPVNTNKTDHDMIIDDSKIKNCRYYVLENTCIVILKHPTKLYFHGVLKVSIIVGNVQIFGYTLTNDPQIVYSLSGASFLCFETFENHNLLLPNEDLIDLGFNKNIVKSLGPSDCVLKFEPYSLSKIHFINNYIPQKIIPYSRKNNKIEQFLKCSVELNDHLESTFVPNPEWNEPIQNLLSIYNSKTIICGGKNVGKSTLFRYTVNKLLSVNEAVLCLDFDIGQSEFTVPGCISVVRVTKPLLGPNYTHLKKPERSYFLGTISVTNNMDGYLYAIKYILDYCYTIPSFQNIPWIINTMGFVRDIGLSIMIHIARMIQPTHIIQITSKKHINNYPKFLSSEFLNKAISMPGWTEGYNGDCTHELFVINSFAETRIGNTNVNWKFHPNELRNVSILSYIHNILNHKNQSLLDVRPYITTMEDVKLVSSEIDEKLVPCLFNGNFVALCNEQKIEDNKVLYICEGYGIVRGIDTKDIYLLTPLDLQTLKNVTHILLAAEPLPPSVYMNTKCVDCSIPFVSAASTKLLRTTVAPRRSTFNIFKQYLKNNLKTSKH